MNTHDKKTEQVVDNKSVAGQSDLKNIPLKRVCAFWNRGFCKLKNNECKFLHINLPACRFKEKCFRYDCQFYHEEVTQKYPFLDFQQLKRREQPNVRQGRWNQPPWKQNVSQHQPRQIFY